MTSLLSSGWSSLMSIKFPDVPEGDYALWITASFIAHWVLFIILPADPWLPKKGEVPPGSSSKKPFDRSVESIKVRSSLVSTFHAIVCVVAMMSWFALYDFDFWNWQRNMQGGIATPGNVNGDAWFPVFACNTVGYFLMDTTNMLLYHKHLGHATSYLHHVVLTATMLVGILTGSGRVYHAIFILEEASTPALHLKTLYKHNPKARRFWEMVFVVTFFLCRGAYGLTYSVGTYYCLFHYWQAYRLTFPVVLDFVVLLHTFSFTTSRLLNVYWMGLIAGKVRGMLKEEKKKVAPVHTQKTE